MALIPSPVMPQGLRDTFTQSLSRPQGGSDPIQQALARAAEDYAAQNAYLDNWWALYADKGRLSLCLQYLYTTRVAYQDLQRRLLEWTTIQTPDASRSDSDVFKFLGGLIQGATDQITALETQMRAGRVAVVGVMTTTQPGPATNVYCPNPNDPYYRGDPNNRRPRRW